jgi:transglutaminase-like putative cysteine protease
MRIRRVLSFSLLAFVYALPSLAVDWRPLDPADLALKQSKTDPNADAEALFREVRVANEQEGANYAKNTVTEYVRLKIFTDRGKEFGNVQIPYFRNSNVFGVEGRTIHPDGAIVELAKDSIFDKVLEKRGFKSKVVTFALPAVEPGSIIEYKFSKSEGETTYRYRQLEVQSEFPVDEVTFYLKPLSNRYVTYPAMRYMPFGCEPERGQPTRDGFDVLTVKNVPAFHEEPYSPPEYSVKKWILIYYEENTKSGKDKYWTALGKDRYKEYSEQIKVNGEIKDLAAQITAGATTDDDKLAKLLNYCRTEIKDVRGDEITTAELEKAKANKSTLDTIRRKEGDHDDIQLAFLALAQAAGYDARRADLSDRATFLFGPIMQSAFFLNAFDIAVNVGGKWKFYDVTNPALPGGQLRWQEQGVYALITDPRDPEMLQTPLLTAQENMKNRFATFTLSDDGVLEGNVREILFGNDASVWREENRHTNDTQREDGLREELKHRFSDFDLSNVKFTVNPDASKPIGLTYHLVVRNYAQRTGKRLFVQPNYFSSGFGSRFPEGTRHNSVYFRYPWGELDSIDLTLPAGFELDHGDSPANLVQYRRQFIFGDKDMLFFEAKVYPNLKKVFDTIHEADNHMLTFKSEAATAPAPSGSAQ